MKDVFLIEFFQHNKYMIKSYFISIQIVIYEHTYWLSLYDQIKYIIYVLVYIFSINRHSVDCEIYRIEFISEFIFQLFCITESNILYCLSGLYSISIGLLWVKSKCFKLGFLEYGIEILLIY